MANKGLARILAVIGGLVVLIEGALSLLGYLNVLSFSLGLPGEGGFIGGLGQLLNAIIAIVVGVLVLISTGTIKSKSTRIGFGAVSVLILGILGIIFGSFIGGILVIIAGILLMV